MSKIIAAVIGSVLSVSAAAWADEPAGPKFKKITLSEQFFSEGCSSADYNKDGKPDYSSGGFWYEGPDFTRKHLYYEGAAIDPKGYSKNFLSFSYDFNNDSWPDIFVVGFPGEESWWFENPQGKDEPWKKHVALKPTDNESPEFGDLTGDGKPELICMSGGSIGWAEPDWADPSKPWTFHKASPKEGRFGRFTHGIGFGDVNGDGKADLLEAKGWWEQPAELKGDVEWKFHKFDFGSGGAQMLTYDVDGDGDNDVISSIAAHGYGLAWFENNGKKGDELAFERHLILSDKPGEKMQGIQFSQMHALALFDINVDGLKDIVTGKRYWAHGPTGDPDSGAAPVLYWFELTRKDGKAEYIAHQIDDNSGIGTQVVATDLNGDKKGDVIVGNKKGQFIFIQE